MSLYNELKRRNVFRVAIAYLAGAWLLIEVAGTLFPAFGVPDWGIRFVVIVLALGFLPALIISWAYELTPEGLKREKDVVRDASITHLTAKRLDWVTIGLIAAALVFIAVDRFWMSPRHPEQSMAPVEVVIDHEQTSESELHQYPPNSIAVLPFVNMSDDAANEYFSDGVSEELLNLLAKIPELRVISRSSSFAFKGEKTDIPTVAKKLNVALVLEGSVRKAGNQVRITAQLIEARSDTHLWSETYDRELVNIFAVQDEISAAIVAALNQRLGFLPVEAPRVTTTVNTEAHDAYLRGRHLVVQRTLASIEGAIREFEKAIILDSNYALAHAELAMAISLLNYYGDLTLTEIVARATPHADKAMALDPNLAEAHVAKGVLFHRQSEYEEALLYYQRAVRINPNYSIIYPWMSRILVRVGRYDESFVALETGLQLDPLSGVAIYNFVPALIYRNRLEEANRVLENIATIYPVDYAVSRGNLVSVGGHWANLALGDLDGELNNPESNAIDSYSPLKFALIGLEEESLALFKSVQPKVLSILGKPGDAVAMAEMRLADDPSTWNLSELGLALAAADDYKRAWPILEELWQKRRGQVVREGLFEVNHAAALIAIRRSAGEEANVDEVLAAMNDNVHRYHEDGLSGTFWSFSADFEEGIYAYLSGEPEKGLRLIARAAEDGYFILPNEAYLQTLYDDPGFAPIRAAQEARQARERNRFLTIVCNDNPYEAVWQPAKGTCERFTETVGN